MALEGRYGPAIDSADAPVNNFYSANDRVLRWLYRAAERTRAVGSDGINDNGGVPSGYGDVDVTDLVADHHSYFQPKEGCLPEVVDRLESTRGDPRGGPTNRGSSAAKRPKNCVRPSTNWKPE